MSRVVYASSFLHTEVQVLDLDSETEVEEVEAAMRRHISETMSGEIKVSMNKKIFRGNLKAFVELSKDLALRLIRTAHLKVG